MSPGGGASRLQGLWRLSIKQLILSQYIEIK
jgi:hypothetical protein